jgi:hypothetical protein
MDATTINAIIGGSCTLLATFVTALLKDQQIFGGLVRLNGHRREALKGLWAGELQQPLHAWGEVRTTVTLTIDASRKKVSGDAIVRADIASPPKDVPQKIVMAIRMIGGFHHDRFLLLEYVNAKGDARQFGSFLLELSLDEKTLMGHFIGYGPFSKALVQGEAMLKRVDT